MIRRSSPSSSTARSKDRAVYREVLSQAFHTAWHEWRFWPLAFFSAILLTGGSYDVLSNAYTAITEQGSSMSQSGAFFSGIHAAFQGTMSNVQGVIQIISGVEAILIVAILLLACAALSCASQGGLVYAIGAMHRGNRPTLAESLRVGGGAFWPNAALNAVVISTLWILRFLAALPLYLALDSTTAVHWTLYLLSFLVFVGLVFIMNIIQVFALNAMILQGSPVNDAVRRAYALFKKHWVVTVETAVILTVLAFLVSMAFLAIYFVLMIPLFASILAAGFLQSPVLLYGAMGLGLVALLVGSFAATAFMTQFQYATWIYLYRRLGEGGVLPKLHRWVRALSGHYTVPN